MRKESTSRMSSHPTLVWEPDRLVFPETASDIQKKETHISIVFLVGDHAYKIKKAVQFPFVDYSTRAQRMHFCGIEMALNRRLAPDVYLGVVPVVKQKGCLVFEGKGHAVDHAVKMRRLPDEWRLGTWLAQGILPDDFWSRLASRLRDFYHQAGQGPDIARWAKPKIVEENWRQVIAQIGAFPPDLLTHALRERLERAFNDEWDRQRHWVEERCFKAREGHGDLRLEHIYFQPDEPAPRDIRIIDAVEFDPRYRCGDPLLDVAFLVMDLEAHGYPAESRQMAEEYFRYTGDTDGDLLSFYVAYRHLIRALARGLQAISAQGAEKDTECHWTQKHSLMAWGKVAPLAQKPCLVLMTGLPGTGKSSLAKELARAEGMQVISSDTVRKGLAGVPLEKDMAASFQEGIYSPTQTERTYAVMRAKTEKRLLEGQRVLVDASFHLQSRREPFARLARDLGVPFVLYVCRTDLEQIRQRLVPTASRSGSDADIQIHETIAHIWEEPPPEWETHRIDNNGPLARSLSRTREVLIDRRLSNGAREAEI